MLMLRLFITLILLLSPFFAGCAAPLDTGSDWEPWQGTSGMLAAVAENTTCQAFSHGACTLHMVFVYTDGAVVATEKQMRSGTSRTDCDPLVQATVLEAQRVGIDWIMTCHLGAMVAYKLAPAQHETFFNTLGNGTYNVTWTGDNQPEGDVWGGDQKRFVHRLWLHGSGRPATSHEVKGMWAAPPEDGSDEAFRHLMSLPRYFHDW